MPPLLYRTGAAADRLPGTCGLAAREREAPRRPLDELEPPPARVATGEARRRLHRHVYCGCAPSPVWPAPGSMFSSVLLNLSVSSRRSLTASSRLFSQLSWVAWFSS